MHKYLAIILSILVSMSIIQPCSDSRGCGSDVSIVKNCDSHDHCQQQDNKRSDDDHQGNAEDDCSPFCICACCHAPVLLSVPVLPSAPVALQATHVSIHFDDHTLEFIPSIWQPPRA
ncbi:MAG: hypothetical protein MI974_11420 [Chitinophagales bacterium]|nr:hypothetical protein [Chitinophagales bacterium]